MLLFVKNTDLTGCFVFHLTIIPFSQLNSNEDLGILRRNLVSIMGN